jgi:hypothetical protein
MKSLFLALMMVCFSVGIAHASFDAYITDGNISNGSYVDRTGDTFGLTESPKLFVNLTGLVQNGGASYWWAPVGDDPVYSGSVVNVTSWLDTPDWNALGRSPGTWAVRAVGASAIDCTNGDCPVKDLTFKFAPEPISASLFLLGGAGLAIVRKKKQA